jgi:hypothetical protein
MNSFSSASAFCRSLPIWLANARAKRRQCDDISAAASCAAVAGSFFQHVELHEHDARIRRARQKYSFAGSPLVLTSMTAIERSAIESPGVRCATSRSVSSRTTAIASTRMIAKSSLRPQSEWCASIV